MDNLEGRHPATAHVAQFFDYRHLSREDMRTVSKGFHDLAEATIAAVPDGPELTAGLRKLLETKDCCVRAVLGGGVG